MHDVVAADLELAHEQVEHVLVDVVADLEPHRGAEPAAGQLALERLQQVLVAVLLDLDVGVAGDAEDVVGDDLEPREQLLQVDADELLERQPAGHALARARARSA